MKNQNWPAYVNLSNGRVVYRPRVKGAPPFGYGVDSRGFLKPPIKLGKPSDSDDLILARYLEARRNLKVDDDGVLHKKHSLFWIRDKYIKSPGFKALDKHQGLLRSPFKRVPEHGDPAQN
nr:hypothetical protein [uncultured Desulfobulbus sp.]